MKALAGTRWKRIALVFGLLLCLGLVGTVSVGNAEIGEPILITSAGQSPGALMLKVLAERAGLAHRFEIIGDDETLTGARSFIVVIGASMKGLSAVGLEVDDEFVRVRNLLERALTQNIPVIAAHIEGAPRRGAVSDDLTLLTFQYASYAIVRADGDADGFFSNLAKRYDVPLQKVPTTAAVTDVLTELYGDGQTQANRNVQR